MSNREIEIDYINHRGERAIRRIDPSYLWWGSTEWHTTPQWLLHAWDVEKKVARDFAWAGIQGPGGIRETIVVDTPIRDADAGAQKPTPALSRKMQFNPDGYSRANAYFEWLQLKGLTEAATEFRERGLLDAANWMPRTEERRDGA